MLRQQLPVYSPITARSLLSGLNAAVHGRTKRLAQELTDRIKAEYNAIDVLLTDSGTSALSLAIRCVSDARARSLVALPAYCCYDIATAADGADVDVLLYDVDPHTLGPDQVSLADAVTQRPAAVIVAHLYGIPVDVKQVQSTAAAAGCWIIEDAAQGHGACLAGSPLGSFGILSVLSFGRGKGVTGGGGGALLAHGEAGLELMNRAKALVESAKRGVRQYVAALAQWALARPAIYGLPSALPFLHLGETIYRKPSVPARMPRTTIAMLLRNWYLSASEAQERAVRATRMIERIDGHSGMVFVKLPAGSRPGYLRLPTVIAAQLHRRLDSPRARRLGIVRGHPTSLADLEGFRHRCVNRDAPFAGARMLATQLFTLPTHSRLTTSEEDAVLAWLNELDAS